MVTRFGGGVQQAIVAQGEPVREGQKLLRVVGLKQMAVQTRVHEALVAGDWSTFSRDGREFLLSADDEREARRLLEDLGSASFETITALHVTAGSEPGIAASVSVETGHTARGIAAIQALAERLAG